MRSFKRIFFLFLPFNGLFWSAFVMYAFHYDALQGMITVVLYQVLLLQKVSSFDLIA